jgi:hypothetical protein
MRGAEADRDDRLADRHDDDEAMALDEVRRRDGEPAFGSPQGREEPFEQPGTGPEHVLGRPSGRTAGDHDRCRCEVGR